MRRVLATLLPVALATACAGGTTDTAGDSGTPWVVPEGGVVELLTDEGADSITLEADYYPVDAEGAPAVVLLHMTPDGPWNRTDWPTELIEAMNDAGYTVLNVDRRGAGGSEGVSGEAYIGPKGKFDVDAAVRRLVDDGYGDLALVGASNGTTSLLDYTNYAADEGLRGPVANLYLSPGTYTVNNSVFADTPHPPSFFAYSDAEKAWPDEVAKPGAPDDWVFEEYFNGNHGTNMFGAAEGPALQEAMLGFLGEHLD